MHTRVHTHAHALGAYTYIGQAPYNKGRPLQSPGFCFGLERFFPFWGQVRWPVGAPRGQAPQLLGAIALPKT